MLGKAQAVHTCYAAIVAADADDAVAQRLRRDYVVAQGVEVLGESDKWGSAWCSFLLGFRVWNDG